MGEGQCLKKPGWRRGRKNAARNIWKRKNFDIIYSAKASRQDHYIMKNIFEILMEKGNPKLAIRYAKRIIKEGEGRTPTEIAPGTKVYELVEELGKYFPEDILIAR